MCNALLWFEKEFVRAVFAALLLVLRTSTLFFVLICLQLCLILNHGRPKQLRTAAGVVCASRCNCVLIALACSLLSSATSLAFSACRSMDQVYFVGKPNDDGRRGVLYRYGNFCYTDLIRVDHCEDMRKLPAVMQFLQSIQVRHALCSAFAEW